MDRPVRTAPLFHLSIELSEIYDVGVVLKGRRRVVFIIGGTFEGERLSGRVVGGSDSLLVCPDGTAELDVRLLLRTNDDCLIYMTYGGVRTGKPEVLERLGRGEAVDPDEFYFRVAPRFETGAEKYSWLNGILSIGVGHRLPKSVEYSLHRVL